MVWFYKKKIGFKTDGGGNLLLNNFDLDTSLIGEAAISPATSKNLGPLTTPLNLGVTCFLNQIILALAFVVRVLPTIDNNRIR